MNRLTVFSIIIMTVLLQFCSKKETHKQPDSIVSPGDPSASADSIPPDNTLMRDLSSLELTRQMSPGWNLGNSLEAIGGETAWGNAPVSKRLIDSVRAAGFKSVRIPVAWSNQMNASTFEIEKGLLLRVGQVINYVLDNGMYAVINIHWDGGWMQPTYEDEDYVNNRLEVLWHQIAKYFRNYDDHLLFAGTNEVLVEGNYGTPTEEYYTVQNGFNQTFVNTVRATGGRNHYRHLVVQGFNTNIDYTVRFFEIPDDAVEDRLMVEVHYYDPYNFTLNANSRITQWGKNATDPSRTETWADESWADEQFNRMKTNFIQKGYGVILGEYAASARTDLGSPELNADHAKYRLYWTEYITGSIHRHGLVPMYWDSGHTGNNASGLFDRTTGAQAYPDIIEAIVDAVNQD